jgi:hypothetical protein
MLQDKENWQIAPTIYERLTPRRLRKHTVLIWIFITALLSLGGVVAQLCFGEIDYVVSSILLSLIVVLLPPFFTYVRNQYLDLDNRMATFVALSKEEREIWIHKIAIQAATGGWIIWTCGIVNVLVCETTVLVLGIPFQNQALYITTLILLVPLFFFCGTSVYTTAYSFTIPSRLARLPIKVPLYQDRYTGITSLNSMIFGFLFGALMLYALLFAAVITGPYTLDVVMLGWLSAIGLLVLLIVPIGLVGLHTAMKRAKREALLKLTPKLEMAIQRSLNEPVQENLDLVESLFKFKEEVQKLPEWPIDFRTGLTLLTTALLPVVAFIVEVFR